MANACWSCRAELEACSKPFTFTARLARSIERGWHSTMFITQRHDQRALKEPWDHAWFVKAAGRSPTFPPDFRRSLRSPFSPFCSLFDANPSAGLNYTCKDVWRKLHLLNTDFELGNFFLHASLGSTGMEFDNWRAVPAAWSRQDQREKIRGWSSWLQDAVLLENLDTQKEKRRVETSSEDPFVQLRHFEPPSLVLWQRKATAVTSRAKQASKHQARTVFHLILDEEQR
ncbi:Hypothetical protein SMAX5B_001791 [Scophthalmus maximus]|uniref:Uncharacterized protein n=1 Tax=Scophthalmus maximus TaxID=52904 RepID=A0A2U9CW57_SCOMX|nr:Hypothetical protein SMAX5B_001791 [Scophthalmus maximus]